MKKIIIAASLIGFSLTGFAQKSNIASAIKYLQENDFAKAKETIDLATSNEATKDNAKAWLVKGVIYQAIGTPKDVMPQMNFVLNDNPYLLDISAASALLGSAPDALNTAVECYKKSFALDNKYSKDELMPLLGNIVGISFNNAIAQLNDNKFQDSYNSFNAVETVAGIDNGNFFKGNARYDTLLATSTYYKGYTMYQMNDYDKALPLFEQSLKSPYLNSADLYLLTAEVYEKQKNDAKYLEVMKAARTKFPSDKRMLNNMINYNINNGKAEESITLLKEAITAEPNKVDNYLVLGQTYANMANPKKGGKPANAAELEKNALEQYNKAIEKDANNIYAQYYIGVMYFNQAKEINDVMIKADDKKYAEMKPKRDELINKSVLHLEKTRTLTETAGINDSNREDYRTALMGLSQAYSLLGKTDKYDEVQKKISGLR